MLETKNFSEKELSCRCCGDNRMNILFLEKLQRIRDEYGKPMKLSSAYRCPNHNNNISSSGVDGPHTTGRAVDVLVAGEDAYHLLKIVMKHNMTGVGIAGKSFIHIDDLPKSEKRHRPVIWTY